MNGVGEMPMLAVIVTGNPTKSYRTRDPLRIVGEITEWQGHPPEQLKAMKDHLERLKEQGIEAIED